MVEIRETEVFAIWLASLRDARARARIAIRIDRLAAGNPGDVRPGYRVYFQRRGNLLVILLCGGDKASQDDDIERARSLARNLDLKDRM